jgi:FKBP12-rapamycin complex-associated protein
MLVNGPSRLLLQRNVEVWQRVLRVRALVISRLEDVDMWLKFSSLCRKVNMMTSSYTTLVC